VTDSTLLRPAPHPAVDTAFLENQAVLFDDRTGKVFELNPSASAVWLLLDGQLTVADVAAELHELMGVPLETLGDDVELAVMDFAHQGLLVGTEPVADDAEVDAMRAPAVSEAAVPTILARPPDP
jgi:hypothetical protein